MALVLMGARAYGAPPSCVGRFVITRATGALVRGPGDVIVLDGTEAVLDPECGAAATRTRATPHGARLTARWPGCRAHRALRLRVRASLDCTLLRGAVTAPGTRASHLIAVASRCGDGVVDPGTGERCDDGNQNPGDGCDATCGRCVDPATLASTWAAIQANVFDRACTSCHGEAATAGLDLRAPDSYARIVGKPSASGLDEIAPGSRTQSLIWLKIAKGTQGGFDDLGGGGMPLGFPLGPDVLEAVGRWIDAGAPPDGVVAGAAALRPPCE